MLKNTFVLAILCASISMVGCAQTQAFLGEYIPTVEAKFAASGFALKIDPKFGIDAFCLDPIGTAVGVMSAVPILGEFTTEFIGVCDTAPVEEVVE